MKSLFQPLIQGILSLATRQYAAASQNGRPPSDLVITGGFARNSWAITYLESEVQKLMPGMKCATEIA